MHPRTEAGENRLTLEIERLKKRIIQADRAGNGERWRKISFIYRAADGFGRRAFPLSFCKSSLDLSTGCDTGRCCRCRPDVFEYEKEVLDLLPKRIDQSGFCPFFNLKRKNCGIYGVRPFACRIYYNFAASGSCCDNPPDRTLRVFEGVKRHLEGILGPYAGGYQP